VATGCPPTDTYVFDFGPVKITGSPGRAYCPRRTVLDKLLVDAAREAGAEVREGVQVRDVIREGTRIVGGRGDGFEARASVVVGADGMNSGIAEAAGAAMSRSHPSLTCGF